MLSTLIGSMFGDHRRGKVYAGICAAGADPLVTPYALDQALAKVQILTRSFPADTTDEETRMVADHDIIDAPRCTSYATCCD